MGHARHLVLLALALAAVRAGAAPRDATGEATQLIARGRYAEARQKLEPLARAASASLEARWQLGRVYRLQGEQALERTVWNGFYDDYEAGKIDRKKARDLAYVARAAHMLGGWKDANDTFRDAVDADPKGKDGARANIAWARLFLEKYDAGHAEVCLDEALKILPEDPEARTLLAAVKLEQSYDTDGALRELDRAEKAQPGHAEAVALRARIALEGEEPERARKLARALLDKNPEDLSARTVLAAAALLEDDRAGYEAERARVLKTNPHASRFFHDVGEVLVREHRYADAVAIEEEALSADDKDAVARAAYGANLLRLGREDEGLAALRAAWKKDRYNVRTYNLLQLFEDVIPKQYTIVPVPPFRLRVPVAEKELLLLTVAPLLQRAEKALTSAYGFAPQGTITIELYTDPKHYAVRTIGLPGLDAIGVTFGPVITAMSPSVGKFNWGMVLWHELSHVYAIQSSRSRVPRWFTEGLSEYETTVADPLWTRRTSADLASALQQKALLPLAQLDLAFLHARNLSQMVLAYHEAAAAVRYFVERAGRKGAIAALRAYGEGKRTPEVLRAVTGEDIATFDAGFRRWLGEKLRGYEGQLLIRPSDYSDVDALERRLKAQPGDGRARGLLAMARLMKGDAEAARLLLDEARGAAAPEIVYASTRVSLLTDHVDDAATSMKLLRSLGARGADVEVLAARVAKARGAIDEAWAALQAAAAADPDRGEVHSLMAELARGKQPPVACIGRPCELEALAHATELDVMDGAEHKRFFSRLQADKQVARAVAAARRTLDITPFDAGLRLELAAVLKDAGKSKEAREELARARACGKLSPEGEATIKKLAAELGR
jgi:cellulose synthase operon protein C